MSDPTPEDLQGEDKAAIEAAKLVNPQGSREEILQRMLAARTEECQAARTEIDRKDAALEGLIELVKERTDGHCIYNTAFVAAQAALKPGSDLPPHLQEGYDAMKSQYGGMMERLAEGPTGDDHASE